MGGSRGEVKIFLATLMSRLYAPLYNDLLRKSRRRETRRYRHRGRVRHFGEPCPAIIVQNDSLADTGTLTVLLVTSTAIEAPLRACKWNLTRRTASFSRFGLR